LIVAEGWHAGPAGTNPGDPTQLGPVIADLVAQARPWADLDGNDDPTRLG
ncbi:MAG: hypothetical protein JWM05_1273, partial [Acidimicrobiales bacterium]|nr:hypothetical protein [Acidimicrobiales bacterium]